MAPTVAGLATTRLLILNVCANGAPPKSPAPPSWSSPSPGPKALPAGLPAANSETMGPRGRGWGAATGGTLGPGGRGWGNLSILVLVFVSVIEVVCSKLVLTTIAFLTEWIVSWEVSKIPFAWYKASPAVDGEFLISLVILLLHAGYWDSLLQITF